MTPAEQTAARPLPATMPGLLPTRTLAHQQRLRLRRFGMAVSTYLLGLAILGLCTLLELFSASALAALALLFVAVNAALLLALATGWNTRFADPSLTAPQVYIGVTMVPIILVLGRDVHFVAAPFYAAIFVFAMLQMDGRALARVAVFVLVSYCASLLLRLQLYGNGLNWRVEAVTATLVVAGSVWFALAASYISNLRARLRGSLQRLAALATYDDLTGLWNRRQIDRMLDAAVNHAERHGSALCVAMADVDHFKRINDRHGHGVGDEVGRFGGEEFVLLLPATTMAQATALVDRLRSRLEALQSLPAGEPSVTASFGVAAWRAAESAGDLVRRADQALYRAKSRGRNRVEADSLFVALITS